MINTWKLKGKSKDLAELHNMISARIENERDNYIIIVGIDNLKAQSILSNIVELKKLLDESSNIFEEYYTYHKDVDTEE